MDKMTIIEAANYIERMDFDGVTLTPSGANAAKAILSSRADWTPSHFIMLNRLESGAMKVPLKLSRLVSRTRLGDALDLVRDLNRKHIKNQKCKARRKAAKARMAAATANTATERAAA